jgi:hypothetical protein
MAFRADGNRLALGSADRDLVLWDTSVPGRPVRTGTLRRGGGITAAAWNPAAVALLATISVDGSIATWRILDDRPPEPTAAMSSPRDRPHHLNWLSGGKHLVGTTTLGRTTVWDAEGRPLVFRGRRIDGLVIGAYGWYGASVLVSHVGQVEIWDPATQLAKSRVLPGRVVASAHSGTLLAVAYHDGHIEIVDHELERRAVIRHPGLTPVRLAFSDDSRALAVAGADGSLAVMGENHQLWWHRPGDGSVPAGIAVAAGLLAVVGQNGTATLTLLESGSAA